MATKKTADMDTPDEGSSQADATAATSGTDAVVSDTFTTPSDMVEQGQHVVGSASGTMPPMPPGSEPVETSARDRDAAVRATQGYTGSGVAEDDEKK